MASASTDEASRARGEEDEARCFFVLMADGVVSRAGEERTTQSDGGKIADGACLDPTSRAGEERTLRKLAGTLNPKP